MGEERAGGECACRCGRVSATLTGPPILRAVCYCTSCRTAGLAFAQAAGAPAVVGDDGGSDLVLYRKDRVGRFTGGALLREHRLTPTSPTRRMVASCCGSPLFLEFTPGHWLSLYAGGLSGDPPPLDMRVMTADRTDQAALPGDVPAYAGRPARFMVRLLAAWAAMGFRTPKAAW
jgi:hypothetical protein